MLKEPTELWDALAAFDIYLQRALFAHCVSLSVNAIYESHDRKPRAVAHADRLAQRVDLDMVAAGWKPTVESFLSRVTKARILGAVREALGNQAAQLIDHLKKCEMAAKAEELLDGSGLFGRKSGIGRCRRHGSPCLTKYDPARDIPRCCGGAAGYPSVGATADRPVQAAGYGCNGGGAESYGGDDEVSGGLHGSYDHSSVGVGAIGGCGRTWRAVACR